MIKRKNFSIIKQLIIVFFLCYLPITSVYCWEASSDQVKVFLKDYDGYEGTKLIPDLSLSGQGDGRYQRYIEQGAANLHLYAPANSPVKQAILDAHQQSIAPLLEVFGASGNPPTFIVILVEDCGDPNASGITRKRTFNLDLLDPLRADPLYIAIEQSVTHPEHTYLHEAMHFLQRTTNKHSGDSHARWYVEGPAQFAPIIANAPDSWINKDLLYSDGNNGRFHQAISQAHGKSMLKRGELAAFFWHYYFKKVHGNSLNRLETAFNSYVNSGYNNEGMSWFSFKDYWHEFALSHINKPGDKTGVWANIDANFSSISASSLDKPAIVIFPNPFGKTITMPPLSQKFYEVANTSISANNYVIFSLPDKDIPEGIEISAVLKRAGSDNWEAILLDKEKLGKHWTIRFPVDGKKYLENDTEIPYEEIAFVISNYSDSETLKLKPVITNHLHQKYKGRGVETKSGVKYFLTGTSIQGKPKTGDGFRITFKEDKIHTRALELWFRRSPEIDYGDEDLDAKAMKYIHDHGKFKGDVYFKYIAIRPEKVTFQGGGNFTEEGKLVVKRERKENFYDTPNLFKVELDKEDLTILSVGGEKTQAAFVKQIEDTVKKKYSKGSFGHTQKQLFSQTMAIDTRAYNEEYELSYKRGEDIYGHYLKIKLGESMWFTLRP